MIIASALVGLSGCSIKKSQSAGPGPDGNPGQAVTVSESDWKITSDQVGGIQRTIRTLSDSKLNQIRQSFGAPALTSVSLPEAGGFEIYYAAGYAPIENIAFIHPKVFVSTSTDKGSIIGYKTGEKDDAGNELVSVSIPVALVDGLVSAIPVTAGMGAVPLPESYKIPDASALSKAVSPKLVQTLSVCPKVFRLTFEGREYRAKSPFDSMSSCPMNQFFRIVFKAPVKEMKKILETAAIQDDAVSIVTDLSAQFVTPRSRTELTISAQALGDSIKQQLNSYEVKDHSASGRDAYGAPDIEAAVVDALFAMLHTAGVDPSYSDGMPRILSGLIDNYFKEPFGCERGGICRTLSDHPGQNTNVSYAWTTTESLSTSIETESVTSLGAVTNSSDFMAKPAWSVLQEANRPKWFGGKSMSAITGECNDLAQAQYPLLPGMDPSEQSYIKGYCLGILATAPGLDNPEENDGYFPLGANTTLYPGAWLRIDLEEISEFTTAKTKTNSDGSVVIESEVKDMMDGDPSATRTSCVEGNQTACLKYSMKDVEVKDPSGDPVFSDLPCRKGDENCSCTKKDDGTDLCSQKLYQFQSVKDYVCDPADEFDYCPYYRVEDEVIDYEREWDCQNIKVDSHTTFLCFGSCSEDWRLVCQLKTQKPITAKRQHLNCKEDDPVGTASREIGCRRPKYLCEEWATRCSHYSVNEAFQIIHEEVAPKWRPFAISKGEYPPHFEDQIDLKFVSPKGTVSNCPLNKFGRFFRGNTLFIKIPGEENEEQPCGVPLWNKDNTQALYLPKVYLRNSIKHAEMRLCGRTEYSFLTEEIPVSGGKSLIPVSFEKETKVTIGPIPNSCRAANPISINSDLWFVEVPPVRFSGRVSVLGRVLESIVTGDGT